jgi:hypothetical protein
MCISLLRKEKKVTALQLSSVNSLRRIFIGNYFLGEKED